MSRRRTAPQPESEPSSVAAWLAEVRALAEDVLGSTQAANDWLHSEAIGLEFRRPVDLLAAPGGVEAVETLLHRMKCGVYC